jgi:predicted dinucleotide-binding enzyme
MKIAVLGTGMVGRALAARLDELGHEVAIGTRDVDATVARPETDGAPFSQWLEAVGEQNLVGKVLLDLAIPLDLSEGLPPRLLTANDDSLGEQIQRAFPLARVVKALHTVYFEVMVDPGRVPGAHSIFVAGEDADAKTTVRGILEQFNWPSGSIIDLGGIVTARATEMYSRLFFDLYAQFGTFDFNVNVVRA